jgi:hypothetical protein
MDNKMASGRAIELVNTTRCMIDANKVIFFIFSSLSPHC